MFGSRKSTPTPSSTPLPPAPSVTTSPASMSSTPPPSNRQPVGYETVLGANTSFKGEVKSAANVRIDGHMDGNIDSEGNILIGETARVVGNLTAKREVRISGAVRGNINAVKIHLSRTGKVWGDLHAAYIVADDGAFVDGKLHMVGHPAHAEGFEGSRSMSSSALPAPEISVLPIAEDIASGESLEVELIDKAPSRKDFKDEKDRQDG
ncbi:MAG: hypothetical protein OHK0023_24650 [Anaerolineae bacterium]